MPYQIPYGVASTIRVPLSLAGVYLTSTPTIAAGDYLISEDGAAYGSLDSAPTWVNDEIEIDISVAEATGKRASIRIHDVTGGEFDDDMIKIETYGHALSAHPNIGEPVGVHGEVDDASATTTSFIGAAGLSAVDDFYNGMQIVFLDGALAGVPIPVVDYVGASRTFTLSPALPSAPADNSRFLLIGRA